MDLDKSNPLSVPSKSNLKEVIEKKDFDKSNTASITSESKRKMIVEKKDLEGSDDDPACTKVVDRRWYEQNKHNLSACVWREFDPEQRRRRQRLLEQNCNPKVIRPSVEEWYPRMLIGICKHPLPTPIYCFFTNTGNFQATLKWAVGPVGDSFDAEFGTVIKNITNTTEWYNKMVAEVPKDSVKIERLLLRYTSQQRFKARAQFFIPEIGHRPSPQQFKHHNMGALSWPHDERTVGLERLLNVSKLSDKQMLASWGKWEVQYALTQIHYRHRLLAAISKAFKKEYGLPLPEVLTLGINEEVFNDPSTAHPMEHPAMQHHFRMNNTPYNWAG